MSTRELFHKRNNIINDIFIDREFNNLMENYYINDLEILEENAITNFFGNIIETIRRFFNRLIETVKNLFRRNKSIDSKTMNDAKETINEAKKQKENNQRKEEARKKAEEVKKKEEEAERAKEEARKKAEEARKAEEEAKRKAEEEAKRKAEEAKRAKEEARKKAEEAKKEAEEAKKEAEDDISIKGYKIQDKKLTMRNYSEKAKDGYWLFSKLYNFPISFINYFGIIYDIDPKEVRTTRLSEWIESWTRSLKPVSANNIKLQKLEDIIYYLPLETQDSTALTKTIDLCDFNIKYYEEFLKCADKFTIDYLKKIENSFLKKLAQREELYEYKINSNDPKIRKEYTDMQENARWAVSKLQSITTETSKQLFKMKKEIEEIIKVVVNISNS